MYRYRECDRKEICQTPLTILRHNKNIYSQPNILGVTVDILIEISHCVCQMNEMSSALHKSGAIFGKTIGPYDNFIMDFINRLKRKEYAGITTSLVFSKEHERYVT